MSSETLVGGCAHFCSATRIPSAGIKISDQNYMKVLLYKFHNIANFQQNLKTNICFQSSKLEVSFFIVKIHTDQDGAHTPSKKKNELHKFHNLKVFLWLSDFKIWQLWKFFSTNFTVEGFSEFLKPQMSFHSQSIFVSVMYSHMFFDLWIIRKYRSTYFTMEKFFPGLCPRWRWRKVKTLKLQILCFNFFPFSLVC